MEKPRISLVVFLLFSLSVVITILVYFPGLDGGFQFDDRHVLENNQHIHVESLDAYSLTRAAKSFTAGGRELSMLSFALNHYFFGNAARWYKFVNLIIHCLNGLGLFLLLRQLVHKLPASKLPESTTIYRDFLALIVVSMWLLHPINLNAVLYISQRMALMSTFFIVYGLVVYVWARSIIRSNKRKVVYLPLVITLFSVLGYLCKENAVLLPLYAFLIECLVLRFRSDGDQDRVVIALYSFAAIALVVVVCYRFWQRPNWITAGYDGRHFDLGERVMTQFRALVYYISLIIAPNNGELSLWHDDFEISRGLFKPVSTILSLLVLVGLATLGFFLATKVPLAALGIFWFFVSHSLESTVFPLELVHEHRNYLASFGILLAAMVLLCRLLSDRKWLLLSLSACLLAGYALVLSERSHIWSNDFSLAEHQARNKPRSPAAVYGLGVKYFEASMNGVKGAERQALTLILQAAENDPYTIVPELLLVMLSNHRNIDYDSAWLATASQKIRQYPHMASSNYALQKLLDCLKLGECDFPPEEVNRLFDVALESRNGIMKTTAAFYYTEVNIDPEKAEKGFRESLDGNDAASWVNLISFLIHVHKKQEACEVYRSLKKRIAGPGLKNLPLFMERINLINRELGECTI